MKRLALLLVACGPRPVARTEPRPPPPVVDAGPPAPPLPSFASLAARAGEVPGMHEALRVERTTELVPQADTCYRALVASEGERVHGSFADALGARGEPGTSIVPPRGPVCARKGEALRFVLDGAARAIVWQSP